MQWIERLETGFADIDSQHRELFNKFGAFLDAHEKGERKEVVFELFTYLKRYVQEHFQTEEKYMKEYHYPKMAEHVEEHHKLIATVKDFELRYSEEGFSDSLTEDIRKVLTDWLLDHIVKTDMELGFYLKSD
ncbi:MAG: hemerythrin [Desulfuromonas sp.]|nr:MAG: hemerythrin [Desulfuromonas sp.]